MENLYGKNIFVSGATSGIGKLCAETLAKEGNNVIGVDLGGRGIIKKLGKGTLHIIPLDVTNIDDIEKVFDNIKRVDIVVLCAGFGIAGPAERLCQMNMQESKWMLIILEY